MADIVQLEENGVMKYLKTHVSAVEDLDSLLSKKMEKVYEGASYLNAGTTVSFTENSFKKNMVLWFSRYNPETGVAEDRQFVPFMVNKDIVDLKEGSGYMLSLPGGASKYFYVSKGTIVGYANNSSTENKIWCLRYVFVN